MSHNKDETAVHCCHCPGDVAVRMSVWCSVCPPHALLLFATTKIRKKQKQQLKTKLSTRTLSISFFLYLFHLFIYLTAGWWSVCPMLCYCLQHPNFSLFRCLFQRCGESIFPGLSEPYKSLKLTVLENVKSLRSHISQIQAKVVKINNIKIATSRITHVEKIGNFFRLSFVLRINLPLIATILV